MRTITMPFLFAAFLIAPFETLAQGAGTESDRTAKPVSSKKRKKKRAPPRAKKPVTTTQSDTSIQPDTSTPSVEVAMPAQPSHAMDPAPAASASPIPPPERPAMASGMSSTTVELAPEREHRGLLMIAPKAGLFKSTTALQAAFYSGIELGVATPLLNRHLALVFELDWVPPHYSGTITDPRLPSGNGAFTLRQSEIGFLLSAVYRFEDALPGLTPYGGLGPGLYHQRASLTAFDGVNVESETKVGFQLLGGADYQLGPGALFGEVRYHFSKVDFVGTGNVNVGGFLALGVGYRLRFF